MTDWRPIEEQPGDGESIWVAVREWDGVHTHTEYAIAFLDMDGLIVNMCEGDRQDQYVQWPPKNALAWMPCNIPEWTAVSGNINQTPKWGGA